MARVLWSGRNRREHVDELAWCRQDAQGDADLALCPFPLCTFGIGVDREGSLGQQEVEPACHQHREVLRPADASRATRVEIGLHHFPRRLQIRGVVTPPIEHRSGQLPSGLGRAKVIPIDDDKLAVRVDEDVLGVEVPMTEDEPCGIGSNDQNLWMTLGGAA